MTKSLKEIEQDFHDKFQQPDLKVKKKSISDIIFGIALIGGILAAIILAVGEENDYLGAIYTITDRYREVILIVVFVLIIISFFLRFIGNKAKKKR